MRHKLFLVSIIGLFLVPMVTSSSFALPGERGKRWEIERREYSRQPKEPTRKKGEKRIADFLSKDRLIMLPGMNTLDAAHYAIAEIHLDKGRYEKAVSELQKVVNESPKERIIAVTHINIANIYRYRMNDLEKAIAELQKVKTDGRERFFADHSLIDIYQQQGKIEEAAQVLRSRLAETKKPRDKAKLLLMLGDLYRKNGEEEKAIAAFEEISDVVSYQEMGREPFEFVAQFRKTISRMIDLKEKMTEEMRKDVKERLRQALDEINRELDRIEAETEQTERARDQ